MNEEDRRRLDAVEEAVRVALSQATTERVYREADGLVPTYSVGMGDILEAVKEGAADAGQSVQVTLEDPELVRARRLGQMPEGQEMKIRQDMATDARLDRIYGPRLDPADPHSRPVDHVPGKVVADDDPELIRSLDEFEQRYGPPCEEGSGPWPGTPEDPWVKRLEAVFPNTHIRRGTAASVGELTDQRMRWRVGFLDEETAFDVEAGSLWQVLWAAARVWALAKRKER